MNFLKEEWINKFKGYKTIENWCKDWNTEGFTLHKELQKNLWKLYVYAIKSIYYISDIWLSWIDIPGKLKSALK